MKTLGILGGLGPMSSVLFYKLITENTNAECDQEHIDIILFSEASTPDRTSFILGNSDSSPLPFMLKNVKKLVDCGADIIAIPCNTAQFFIDEINKNFPMYNILNIIKVTVEEIKKRGLKKVGILATKGTIYSNSYQKMLNEYGIDYFVPDEAMQDTLMNIIYNDIKESKEPNYEAFNDIIEDMITKEGCDGVILGCTELSLIDKGKIRNIEYTIDSLEVLANKSIIECGATLKH